MTRAEKQQKLYCEEGLKSAKAALKEQKKPKTVAESDLITASFKPTPGSLPWERAAKMEPDRSKMPGSSVGSVSHSLSSRTDWVFRHG